jgi:chromosome partitioning protein
MGVVFAVVNQKGGVGKTTTTISLATAFALHGRRTLVVDADPQANATTALGLRQGDTAGLYDSLVEDTPLEAAVTPTAVEGLSIVPTNSDLAGAEVELVPATAREYRLRRILEPLRDAFEVIFLDCPPSLGLLTVNALTAADEVIIPVQCEYLALEGLGHLSQTIRLVQSNLNPALRVRGIVLTMFDGRTNLAKQVEDEVRKHFQNTFRVVIPRSVRLSEAPSFGQPIQIYDPRSPGAIAYNHLAEELMESMPAPQSSEPTETPHV